MQSMRSEEYKFPKSEINDPIKILPKDQSNSRSEDKKKNL